VITFYQNRNVLTKQIKKSFQLSNIFYIIMLAEEKQYGFYKDYEENK